ncbi:MAG: DNA topoisomerase VI subunit B [Candidatus Sifarchaeia archaeon]
MTKTQCDDEGFRSISPAEFFYRNRQMAGFGNSTQAVYSTVRELVENSLDACEDAQQLPRIRVDIESTSSDTLTVTVADNGTGVPYSQVPEAFGRVLYGSKYDRRQKRGTFGLGVTMAVLHGQITTDSPVLVHTRNGRSSGMAYKILVDIEKNVPVVEEEQPRRRDYEGTTVSINLRGDLKRAQERVLEYLKLTTVASPHARIQFMIDDSLDLTIGGLVDTIPAPPRPSKPHPRAADMEMLRKLIEKSEHKDLRSFLIHSFQQVGDRSASRLLKFMGFHPNTDVNVLTREEISLLGTVLRSFDGFGRPDSRSLNPIGPDDFPRAIQSTFSSGLLRFANRGPCEWEGNAFVLEGVVCYGDEFPSADIPTMYRFANRVPLLYDASECVLAKTLKRVNWSRYGARSSQPAALFIHFCSTKVPYKAAGKQSIAHLHQIEEEALALYRKLGRALNVFVKKKEKSSRETKRIREFSKMFSLMARYGAALAGYEKAPSTSDMIRRLFEGDVDV